MITPMYLDILVLSALMWLAHVSFSFIITPRNSASCLRPISVQTWAPPKMLQRRREAVFHSAAAAYRRLEPIFLAT